MDLPGAGRLGGAGLRRGDRVGHLHLGANQAELGAVGGGEESDYREPHGVAEQLVQLMSGMAHPRLRPSSDAATIRGIEEMTALSVK